MTRQKSRVPTSGITRETFCHICHISSGTSRRKFANCTKCSAIVCKPCVENTGAYWSSVQRQRDWTCQKCLGTCPCKKCFQASGPAVFSDLRKRTRSEYDPKGSKNTPEPPSSPDEAEDEEINENSPVISSPPDDLCESPKKQKIEHIEDTEGEAEEEEEERDLSYIQELVAKNQQCLEYLARTTRLLEMIQREQKNIEQDLSRLNSKNKSNNVPASIATAGAFPLDSDSPAIHHNPTATT